MESERPLPENLAELPAETLEQAVEARERRLTRLFRRWPKLTGEERSNLRRLYGERLRLARALGSRRSTSSRPSHLRRPTQGLDGVWRVRRLGGFLPPLIGVRKIIDGDHGWTTVGPVRAAFDVVGNELHYRGILRGLVDKLEPHGDEWSGRALLRGREYGRFRLEH
jgi:hypothetical protein